MWGGWRREERLVGAQHSARLKAGQVVCLLNSGMRMHICCGCAGGICMRHAPSMKGHGRVEAGRVLH